MHELPVAQSILEIALRHASQAGAIRVTDLHLVIGQFASIVDDSIQFYWEIIAKETPAEGARLHFRRIPAQMHCQQCQTTFPLGSDDFTCPDCGGDKIQVVAGNEFFLEAIDVDL